MRAIDADALIEFCAVRWIPLNIDAVNMQPTIQPVATDINVGDIISRQAAIDTVVFECGEWTGLAKEISKQLRRLPSVQPERKNAQWIPVTNGRGGHECSRCHDYAPSYQNGEEYLANYCPNCGVKMERRVE